MADKKTPRHRRQCGFNSGYQAHLRHGEEPCPGCRRAHAAWMQAHRTGGEKRYAPERRTAAVIAREQDAVMRRFLAMSDEEIEKYLAGEDDNVC